MIKSDLIVALTDQSFCGSLANKSSLVGCYQDEHRPLVCWKEVLPFACAIRIPSSVVGQLTGVMIACVTGRIVIHISLT